MTAVPTLIITRAIGKLGSPNPDFDDTETIGGFPFKFNLFLSGGPIRKINFGFDYSGDVIDTIRIAYRESKTEVTTVTHGKDLATSFAENTANTITVDENEILIAVSGRHGTNGNTTGVVELRFTKLNRTTGIQTVVGPFGPQPKTGALTEVFYASGPIIAFMGKASSGTTGGLNALAFIVSNSPIDNVEL